MSKKKSERANFRISEQDQEKIEALTKKLNLDASSVWRLALQRLYEQEVKQD